MPKAQSKGCQRKKRNEQVPEENHQQLQQRITRDAKVEG